MSKLTLAKSDEVYNAYVKDRRIIPPTMLDALEPSIRGAAELHNEAIRETTNKSTAPYLSDKNASYTPGDLLKHTKGTEDGRLVTLRDKAPINPAIRMPKFPADHKSKTVQWNVPENSYVMNPKFLPQVKEILNLRKEGKDAEADVILQSILNSPNTQGRDLGVMLFTDTKAQGTSTSGTASSKMNSAFNDYLNKAINSIDASYAKKKVATLEAFRSAAAARGIVGSPLAAQLEDRVIAEIESEAAAAKAVKIAELTDVAARNEAQLEFQYEQLRRNSSVNDRNARTSEMSVSNTATEGNRAWQKYLDQQDAIKNTALGYATVAKAIGPTIEALNNRYNGKLPPEAGAVLSDIGMAGSYGIPTPDPRVEYTRQNLMANTKNLESQAAKNNAETKNVTYNYVPNVTPTQLAAANTKPNISTDIIGAPVNTFISTGNQSVADITKTQLTPGSLQLPETYKIPWAI